MTKKTVKKKTVVTKITVKNYHTSKNKYLSNSKIRDYLRDKRYFYELHIAKTRERDIGDALIIGSAVDTLLFFGQAKFDREYTRVVRRSKKNQSSLIELNEKQYDDVVTMVNKVKGTTAYKEVKAYKKQQIFTLDMPLGKHFKGLCGMLDWFHYDKKKDEAVIVDFKTARTISERRYYHHCAEFGYFNQLAMYGMLVEKEFNPKTIKYRHLTVEKDASGLFHTQAFEFDEKLIHKYRANILSAVSAIKDDTTFEEWDTSFKSPIFILDKELDTI